MNPLSPNSTWNVIRDARKTNKFLDAKVSKNSSIIEKKNAELKEVEYAILQTDAKIDVYDKEIDECSIKISKLNEMIEKYENKSKKMRGAIKTLAIKQHENLIHLTNTNDELKSCEHKLQNQSIKLKTKNSEDNTLISKIDKLEKEQTENVFHYQLDITKRQQKLAEVKWTQGMLEKDLDKKVQELGKQDKEHEDEIKGYEETIQTLLKELKSDAQENRTQQQKLTKKYQNTKQSYPQNIFSSPQQEPYHPNHPYSFNKNYINYPVQSPPCTPPSFGHPMKQVSARRYFSPSQKPPDEYLLQIPLEIYPSRPTKIPPEKNLSPSQLYPENKDEQIEKLRHQISNMEKIMKHNHNKKNIIQIEDKKYESLQNMTKEVAKQHKGHKVYNKEKKMEKEQILKLPPVRIFLDKTTAKKRNNFMYPSQLDHFLAKGCSKQKQNNFYDRPNHQSPPIFEKPFKSILNAPSSATNMVSPTIPDASEFQFVSPRSIDYSYPSRRISFTSPKSTSSQINHKFRVHGDKRFSVKMHKQKNKETMEKMKDLNALMEEASGKALARRSLNAGKV